jgi:hypothetical protein
MLKDFTEQSPRHSHLGHLKHYISRMPLDLGNYSASDLPTGCLSLHEQHLRIGRNGPQMRIDHCFQLIGGCAQVAAIRGNNLNSMIRDAIEKIRGPGTLKEC